MFGTPAALRDPLRWHCPGPVSEKEIVRKMSLLEKKKKKHGTKSFAFTVSNVFITIISAKSVRNRNYFIRKSFISSMSTRLDRVCTRPLIFGLANILLPYDYVIASYVGSN